MPGYHNVWSPSKLERGIKCPGSMGVVPDSPEKDEEDAELRPWLAEGTLAHAVCESLLKGEPIPEGATEEMINYGEDFRDYVLEIAQDGEIIVEEKLEHPHLEDFGGTPDVLIKKGTEYHIIDYKFGKGQLVRAGNNYQLRGYLVLAMRHHGKAERYYGHIFQPRLGEISVDSWDNSQLTWFEHRLTMAMMDSRLTPGAHCRWCPVLGSCTAAKAAALQAAQMTFSEPEKEEDWKFLLDNKEAIESVIRKAEEKAVDILMRGAEFDGYKVVESYGRETWTDEEAARELLEGIGPEAYNTRLKTPTQLRNSGLVDAEALEGYTLRNPQGPKVVKISDKREAINPVFKELK